MNLTRVKKIGSLTKTADKCYQYMWTIDFFDQIPDVVRYGTLRSPDFTTGEENWFMQLCFTNYNCKLSLISKRSTEGIEIIISVMNEEEVIDTQIEKSKGDQVTFEISKLGYRSRIEKLRVVCVLITSENRIRKSKYSITNDLKLILKSEKLSDVTLTVDKNQFHVHKTILASRSPVFLAMFENNMVENIENKVEITDIDSEVMKIIIVYIYTDEVENLEEKALNVLPAANKYSLEELKLMCGEALSDTLTVDNALQILVLADMYNVNNLKQKTLTFIAEHLSEIISTEEFNRFKNCHRQFIDEILATLATKIII